MNWSDFYLFCFLFGFFFSVGSVLSGHFHLDFQHGHGHGGLDLGSGHNAVHSGDATAGHHTETRVISPFNMGTLAAFLAWFGGGGFLSTKFYGLWFVPALAIALASGIAGAGFVFWFLSKVLMREREEMDPAMYDMIGVLGEVSSTIRSNGIGEVLYSRDGARRSIAARSEDGLLIPSGAEVVVTRYESGVAYVRRWEDMTGSASN